MAPAEIVVSDPVRVGGVKPFVLYRVTSRLFDDRDVSVLRRYSDFDWLLERLRSDHKDCVVPPLPPKQLVGALEDEFIESRRRGLQRFLSKVASHTKLSQSQHFRIFLTESDEKFAATRNLNLDVVATASTTWVNRFTKQIVVATKTLAESISHPLQETISSGSGDSDAFDEKHAAVLRRESLHRRLSLAARSTVQRSQASAAALLALGQSLSQFGRAEEDEELAAVCVDLGNALVAVAGVNRGSAERDAALFEEPLAEAVGMAEAIRIAFENRREVKDAHYEVLQRVSRKRDEVEGVEFFSDYIDPLAVEEMAKVKATQLDALKDVARKSRQSFDSFSSRILDEHLSSINLLASDMKECLPAYAQGKVRCIYSYSVFYSGLINVQMELGIKSKLVCREFVSKYPTLTP